MDGCRRRRIPVQPLAHRHVARDVLAAARRADRVGTIDVLFAVLTTYGSAFDRALYIRGTSREELLERLVSTPDRAIR